MHSTVQLNLLNHLAGLQTTMGASPILSQAQSEIEKLPGNVGIWDIFLARPADYYNQKAIQILAETKTQLGSASWTNCADVLTRERGGICIPSGVEGPDFSRFRGLMADAVRADAGRSEKKDDQFLNMACLYYSASCFYEQMISRGIYFDEKAAKQAVAGLLRASNLLEKASNRLSGGGGAFALEAGADAMLFHIEFIREFFKRTSRPYNAGSQVSQRFEAWAGLLNRIGRLYGLAHSMYQSERPEDWGIHVADIQAKIHLAAESQQYVLEVL